MWQYALDAGEALELPFWVRMPAVEGDIQIRALVQTGSEPDYVDHTEQILMIRVEPRP